LRKTLTANSKQQTANSKQQTANSKPANQQTSKPANQQTSKPANNKRVSGTSDECNYMARHFCLFETTYGAGAGAHTTLTHSSGQ
jgi:hypothetical protein